MNSIASTRITRLVAFFVGLTLLGCGSKGYEPISGTVTYEGTPLASGVITLFPAGAGTTVGGKIENGKFSLPTERGPTPGKYRVEIIAFRPTGKKEFDIDQNKNVDIEEQYLPARYNTKSTLEAEVTAGQPNNFDFQLKP